MMDIDLGAVWAPTTPTPPTPLGIFASGAILKKRRARANKLARVGMRLHGFNQDDTVAWSVFYQVVDTYLRTSGYFQQNDARQTAKQSAAINALYEKAAAETNFKKNLF